MLFDLTSYVRGVVTAEGAENAGELVGDVTGVFKGLGCEGAGCGCGGGTIERVQTFKQNWDISLPYPAKELIDLGGGVLTHRKIMTQD
jgi:hypothetical protein